MTSKFKVGDSVFIKNTNENYRKIKTTVKDVEFFNNFDTYLYTVEGWNGRVKEDELDYIDKPEHDIDWNNIDKKYNYAAMEENGFWYVYKNEPKINHLHTKRWTSLNGVYDSIDFEKECNWKTSLTQRPEKDTSPEGKEDAKVTINLEFSVFPKDTLVYVDVDQANTIKRGVVCMHRTVRDDDISYCEYEICWENDDHQENQYAWINSDFVYLTAEEAFFVN